MMNADSLAEVNSQIKTVSIERKDKKTGEKIVKQYAPTNERVKAFRKLFPTGRIMTTKIEDSGSRAVFEAEVFDEAGRLLATGHAFEEKDSSYINKTSYIENCETSAVGRALGFLGIGIDDAIASQDELAAVEAQQEKARVEEIANQKLGPIRGEATRVYIEENGYKVDKVLQYFNADSVDNLTEKQMRDLFDMVESSKKKKGKQ